MSGAFLFMYHCPRIYNQNQDEFSLKKMWKKQIKFGLINVATKT